MSSGRFSFRGRGATNGRSQPVWYCGRAIKPFRRCGIHLEAGLQRRQPFPNVGQGAVHVVQAGVYIPKSLIHILPILPHILPEALHILP